MAEVFRATDTLLGRDVAVKVFRSVGATDDAAGAGRQEVELQALARLSHPNLITLFDASITDQPPYLVMELVDGPNLAARLAGGPLPEGEVRIIGAQIADALGYVHAHGMVHRDVKPANILLGDDGTAGDGAGRARLSDFGIVRLLGSERLTAADFTLGTASYLAPEQARGGDVTPAADVYSLGLVLIEALTGKRSFDGPPVEAVLARLARDPEIPAELPAPWPPLLRAMTARDPETRPTPADVSRALRAGTPVVPAAAAVGAAVAAMGAGTAADAQATSVIAPWSGEHPSGPLPPARTPSAWSVSGPQPVAPEFVDVEERGRGGRWLLLTLLFVMVIVGAACFLAFGSPTGRTGTGTPAGGAPTTAQHRVSAPHTSAVVANVPQKVAPHPASSAAQKASHSAAPKVSHSAPPASAAAPTTSAPAPSTSSPPPSSDSAPSTSAVPATTEAIAAPPPSSP